MTTSPSKPAAFAIVATEGGTTASASHPILGMGATKREAWANALENMADLNDIEALDGARSLPATAEALGCWGAEEHVCVAPDGVVRPE